MSPSVKLKEELEVKGPNRKDKSRRKQRRTNRKQRRTNRKQRRTVTVDGEQTVSSGE